MARNRLQFDINAKDKTKRAFSTLKRGLKGVSKAIFNMKTGLAAVAGVAGLGLLIRNSLNSIDKLGKLSRQVFISTERLGAFRLSAELGGTSLEAFAKGVRTMAVGINDWLVKGTGIAQDAFIQLGITQDDLRATNGDLFEQFKIVANALREMQDGTDKTAAAYKLFGGRNIELLTAIENGTMGMEEQFKVAQKLGLVMSKELVAGVEAANDSMSLTKLGIKGLIEQMTARLAPAILRISDNIREKLLNWVEKTHGSMDNFGNFLATKMVDSLGKFAEIMIHVSEAIVNTAISFSNLGIAVENTGKFFTELFPKYKEFNQLVDFSDEKILKLKKTISGLTGSGEEDTIGKIFNAKELEDARKRIEATETKVREEKIKKEKEAHDKLIALEKDKFDRILKANKAKNEQDKKLRKEAIADIRSNLEGTLTIMSGNSKKAFKMLQAHKIAEAVVNTYSAVMRAFSTYAPPYSYAAAGSALAFGLAQVQQIRSQKFTARRQGGLVSENKPYMVGEGGPETFIPNSAGYIAPGVGGKNVNVNFTINAVDTAGFQQLLANERGMIIGMINSAVNDKGQSNLI